MTKFKIKTNFSIEGDQERAIDQLVGAIEAGVPYQTLLGVTGSGKTFTMAKVIERVQKPTLVLAHNKILAAQLYREFSDFFPDNAVEYFVSYYDYYQPEAYIPRSDTYIEKDSSINEELDKMRLATSKSVLTRRDVIVVSSVSCIYGIGSPQDFHEMVTLIERGRVQERDDLLRRLVRAQYQRSDMDFHRGTFRVRGDVVDIYPAYEDKNAIRVEFFGDEIEAIHEIDPLTGKRRRGLQRAAIYPSSFYVTGPERMAAMSVARQLGVADKIKYLGNHQAVENILPCADLLFQPSEHESFGLTPLEAMACEVPVLGTNSGGIVEVVEHGVTGYLTEVGDIDAMADYAIRILTDEEHAKELGRRGRERAARLFSKKDILRQYEALYEEVLAR